MLKLFAIFKYLYPDQLLIDGDLKQLWSEKLAARFRKTMIIMCLFGGVAFYLHYFFVDLPANKQPRELWAIYRFGVGTFSLAVAAFYYFTKGKAGLIYRLPYLLLIFATCYLQSRTLVWYPKTPFLFGVIMAFIMTWGLGTNILFSLLINSMLLGIQVPAFVESGVPSHLIPSTFILFSVLILFTGSAYGFELEAFLSDCEFQRIQKKIIENTIEFSDQIQSFLPKQISNRMKRMISDKNLTILQAVDEVLRQRTKLVACLFSDIRGYTQQSKNITYLKNSILKEISEVQTPIEEYQGIPRKVGDLIFAYFDSDNYEMNIMRALAAGIEIGIKNSEFNQRSDGKIVRRVIITSGEATVGNIGSNNSTVEITAMGTPVNLCARLDELTKNINVQNEIGNDCVIMSKDTFFKLEEVTSNMLYKQISLDKLEARVRDFPLETEIFVFESSTKNLDILFSYIMTKISTKESHIVKEVA